MITIEMKVTEHRVTEDEVVVVLAVRSQPRYEVGKRIRYDDGEVRCVVGGSELQIYPIGKRFRFALDDEITVR